APDTRVRKMLFKTDQLWSEIACYEGGQSTVMHTHPREEEAIFVLEGTANMNIAGEEVVVPAGAIVKFPSNVPHDVRNLGNARCVIIDRKSTRLNSSHVAISYAVFCSKKKSGEAEQQQFELAIRLPPPPEDVLSVPCSLHSL